MLATFDEQGALGALGVGKTAAVDHAQADGVAGVDEQVARHAQFTRVGGVFVSRATHHQGATGLVHAVDVEHHIGRVNDGQQLARPAQFAAVSLALQDAVAPHTVEVFIDKTRLVRGLHIKTRKRVHVGKRQAESAMARLEACAEHFVEQVAQRDGAANLIAVGERLHQHLGARAARIEMVHVGHTAVAVAPGADVGRAQFYQGQVGHGFSWGEK